MRPGRSSPARAAPLRAVPVHLKEANAFVARHHRHSLPSTGGKFALGCQQAGRLVGVAIAGRPLSRLLDDGVTLEVLRVCTDGTPNSCSFLYGRVARVAALLGYTRLVTYTLASEPGASLKAAGFMLAGRVQAREWSRPSRGRRSQPSYQAAKLRWDRRLHPGS